MNRPHMIGAIIAAIHTHDVGSGSSLGGLPDGFPIIDHLLPRSAHENLVPVLSVVPLHDDLAHGRCVIALSVRIWAPRRVSVPCA